MTRIKLWLAAIGAALVALFTFGQFKKREGRKEAENEAIQEDVETAKRINEVRGLDPADARQRLRERQSRRDL